MPDYERIEHTADLAIRVWGNDLPALFAHAATALFEMMTLPPPVSDREREITLNSIDGEGLLVDWLNALIYLHEVEGESYTRFDFVELTDTQLQARVTGGLSGASFKTIKAATFHDLTITRHDGGVEATIVFDV